MSELLVDAHLHTGFPAVFFAPQTTAEQLLVRMNQLGIKAAVCTDQRSIIEGCGNTLPGLRKVYEHSKGRIFYLGAFHPGRSEECLSAMEQAQNWPGFVGLKIHPSWHRCSAEDPAYDPAWRFATEHNLAILTHSWSVSDYNPVQTLSTPARFEKYLNKYPEVRLVLGHAGGRGRERADAVRMARDYPNVYLDIGGDIFCYRLIESFLEKLPADKILFGSDYPWFDLSANLTRVLLADVEESAKRKILGENAREVYRLNVV